jgi:hypothetical protein
MPATCRCRSPASSDREKELEWLQQILLSDEAHLVTLTGAGGSGKTRLAFEVARRLVEPLHGAVWFVPLADLTDPQRIADVIRDALRLPRLPHVEPLEQVVEALSRQPSLLVLDNLEHLLSTDFGSGLSRFSGEAAGSHPFHPLPKSVDSILTLLARVPTLTLLVTSRQLLGLEAEREFVVPPLPTPGGAGIGADRGWFAGGQAERRQSGAHVLRGGFGDSPGDGESAGHRCGARPFSQCDS